MSCGTFGLLLSQPEERRRFWRIKAGLLALAMLSAWSLFVLCWRMGSRHLNSWQVSELVSFADLAQTSGLLALLAYSGGLWSTLLLRDMTTAFFATVLAPVTIYSETILCADRVSAWRDADWRIVCLPLVVYAVAGFLAARRLFLRAEDVPWIEGRVSLASARGWPFRWVGFGFQKKRGPWLALVLKELQLQEVTMAIVPLLLLLHLVALAVRHFAPVWAAHLGFFNSEFLWIWMVAPVVVGCVAVAEERRWNTLEGFLCLPARKRSQFLVKFAVVMTLGTALGGVLPSVLEYIGGGNGEWSAFDGWSTPFEALSTLVLFAAGVTTVSFFASTMSRGMLQGVTVALSAIILSRLTYGLLFEMLERLHLGVIISGNGFRLFPTLVWPAMLIAYFWLAFRNFTSLQTGWRLWARNYLWLAAVFASVLLAAVAISRLLLFL